MKQLEGDRRVFRSRGAQALRVGVWMLAGAFALGHWELAADSRQDRPALESESLESWSSGPVQWLLLQSDWKALKKSKDSLDGAIFIENFWRQRDPDPLTAGNPVRDLFEERVKAADRLYFEEQDRGSLTDRGRAYILLGSPSHVQITHRPALVWANETASETDAGSRDLKVEVWGFRLQDLPPGILDSTMKKGGKEEALPLTLTFRHDREHVRLMDGERLLVLAARSYVRTDQP